MAVQPGYDANRFPSAPIDLQRNKTVTDTYEPGSTFKLMTVAGALSERIVAPTTRFRLPYSLHVADRVVHDAEERGTVNYSVAQILAHSSNIGAITLAQMLGRTRLSSWISRFGFGRTTGVDFPGESPGIVLPPDKWSGSTIGNVPIGQGIAVTPVQMAAAYAAIANRGIWSRPHLVDHVAGGGRPSLNKRRLVSPRTADAADDDVEGRRGRGNRAVRGDARVSGRRQNRNRAEARFAGRLRDRPLRRIVRRESCLLPGRAS